MGLGQKRKRLEYEGESVTPSSSQITHKVYAGIKEIRRGAKKAKTFEMQKLVKELKKKEEEGNQQASKSHLDFNSPIHLTYLKSVNHERLGDHAFHSKLMKDRLLSSSENVMAAASENLHLSDDLSAQPGTAEARILARLFSSKILAQEVGSVITRLRMLIQPGESSNNLLKAGPKEKREARSNSDLEISSESESGSDRGDDEQRSEEPENSDDRQLENLPDEDDVGEDAGWESGSLQDGVGWESGSVGDGVASSHSSPDSSDLDDDVSGRGPSAKRPKTPKSRDVSRMGTSTFLPSLAVGFTRGDTDGSDWSDAEADAADDGKRKNRRGQRARKAIWEKKYGSNANHIKKQKEESVRVFRDRRVPAFERRNPGYGDHGKHPGERGRSNNIGGFSAALKNPAPEKSTPKVDERPLHPSWEAKRRMKEKETSGIVLPQGKKIVFS